MPAGEVASRPLRDAGRDGRAGPGADPERVQAARLVRPRIRRCPRGRPRCRGPCPCPATLGCPSPLRLVTEPSPKRNGWRSPPASTHEAAPTGEQRDARAPCPCPATWCSRRRSAGFAVHPAEKPCSPPVPSTHEALRRSGRGRGVALVAEQREPRPTGDAQAAGDERAAVGTHHRVVRRPGTCPRRAARRRRCRTCRRGCRPSSAAAGATSLSLPTFELPATTILPSRRTSTATGRSFRPNAAVRHREAVVERAVRRRSGGRSCAPGPLGPWP